MGGEGDDSELVTSTRDDAALVAAARAGDVEAWVQLYRGVYPRLRAYMVRRVGAQHAEDAVSDTVCRAVAGVHRLEVGPAGFDGWIFGIARRVAADHHRRAGRRPRVASDVPGDSGPEPGDALSTFEDHRQLRQAFARLTPADRELLELRVVAGLSAEQVAAVLGKRAGAVRTAQSRALARLRALLTDDGDVT